MLINFDENLRNELEYIISGKSKTGSKDLIETTSCYLRTGKGTNTTIEQSKSTKVKETKELVIFIEKNHLWYTALDETKYIGEGAEQKVYLQNDGKTVVKLNDAVFYLSWLDYLTNLQIHNVLFPDTKYSLLGFMKMDEKLLAVVEQPYVCSTSVTKLDDVKGYLSSKGFINKKNNDYYHEEMGIILEDLHDENVLTNRGILFFIDTTFYVTRNTS